MHLDIHLSIATPIVLFVQLFDYCMILHGLLNGVLFFIYISMYIY